MKKFLKWYGNCSSWIAAAVAYLTFILEIILFNLVTWKNINTIIIVGWWGISIIAFLAITIFITGRYCYKKYCE